MSIMRTIIAAFALILVFLCRVFAADPTLEEKINSLWKEKKYDELQVVLDTKAKNPPDIVAVYCAKFFYLFIKPDKAKALVAAGKLKLIADKTKNSNFQQMANYELQQVQGVPDAEFAAPGADKLDALHAAFPDSYPNIKFGSALKKSLIP